MLSPAALGLPAGVTSDDISFGNDVPGTSTYAVFSVDNTSIGYPLASHDVYAEAAGPDGAAAADVFVTSTSWTVSCTAAANQQIIDGDGLLGDGLSRNDVPGLGLDESPAGAPGTSGRDELSSLEMSDSSVVEWTGDGVLDSPVFFTLASLDAALLGFPTPSGADIYMKPAGAGAAIVRFASASALGLQLDDDIDALAVHRPGTLAQFDPSTHTVVFSLKRGSSSLGSLPTTCGVASGAATGADLWSKGSGAVAPYLFAERLGLCVRRAHGGCNPYISDGNDNIDAIDLVTAGGVDQDGDGIDDAVDPDDNNNGQTDLIDPCPSDPDGDCLSGAQDNCPAVYNLDQRNSDSGRVETSLPGNVGTFDNNTADLTALVDDYTLPGGDGLGDACDPDLDNDGLSNTDEFSATACDVFDLSGTTHPRPAGGDNTNDDNHNGNPVAPMGTDSADNGASWDTDGDGRLDGYECAHNANPRDRLSLPTALADDLDDDDGDGLKNGWERRGWGTNPNVVDSDGDGLGDCKEALDLDGNGTVNSSGDMIRMSNVIFKPNEAGKTMDYDLDKNGQVNSSGDLIIMAQRVFQGYVCL